VLALALIAVVAVLGSWVLDLRRDRGLTHPLGSVAGLYGRALVFYLTVALAVPRVGWRGGPRGSVCVNTAFPDVGGAGSGHAARAGASISAGGDIHHLPVRRPARAGAKRRCCSPPRPTARTCA